MRTSQADAVSPDRPEPTLYDTMIVSNLRNITLALRPRRAALPLNQPEACVNYRARDKCCHIDSTEKNKKLVQLYQGESESLLKAILNKSFPN